MEKEFIPYEQALALKELGFDEPCIGRYGPLKVLVTISRPNSNSYYKDSVPSFLAAPTFSQAFRWFREKYDLIYFITPEGSINNRGYLYSIKDWKAFVGTFGQTYEEAELECLKKLIEIVKQK